MSAEIERNGSASGGENEISANGRNGINGENVGNGRGINGNNQPDKMSASMKNEMAAINSG
jgi:hypothetical protein